MRKIELLSYNPKWVKLFNEEEGMLESILGDVVARIHHIGSTSVVGLTAKPIIDIMMEVKSFDDLESRYDGIIARGYTPKGEFGIPGRRFFVKGGENPTHHIHAFVIGDANIARHLAFRNLLRSNPDAIKQYQDIKQHALTACNNDINKYCELKNDFIKSAEDFALSMKLGTN